MTEFELDTFAHAVLKNTYDVSIVAPVDPDAALAEAVGEIEGLLALNSEETREGRFLHFAVPGTTRDSYCEKIFELQSGILLAGIRHAGGDPKLPFVNVTAGFEVTAEGVREIAKVLTTEFSAFRPRHFATWIKPEAESTFQAGRVTLARRYLARRISDLDLGPKEAIRLELRPFDNERYYEWYLAEYRWFHISNPGLKSWVTVNEKTELESYRGQGLLRGAYIDDQLIGVIGGENQSLLGIRGLYIGELLISNKYKGRGLSVQMQRQFLVQVGSDYKVVWGTIDDRNLPSTRAALRVGRRAMRTECFLPLE